LFRGVVFPLKQRPQTWGRFYVKYRLRFFPTHRALRKIKADMFNKNNPSFGVAFLIVFANHQAADSMSKLSHSFGSVLLEQASVYRSISSFLESWYVVLTLS
jgi:hypothetical protein